MASNLFKMGTLKELNEEQLKEYWHSFKLRINNRQPLPNVLYSYIYRKLLLNISFKKVESYGPQKANDEARKTLNRLKDQTINFLR